MRLLDRHVLSRFVRSILFALLAFSVIFILIDMVENLDDFIDQNVPTHIIGLYYVYFLPRIMGLMVPLAMLLAALFVVGKMSSTNELTVIKCSGVSLYRYMVPFVAMGVLVSVAMLGIDGYVVPRINAARLDLERTYLKKNLQAGGRYNLFFQDRDDRIVSMEYFDDANATARRVSVQRFRADDPTRMIERIDAAGMRWSEARGTWMLVDGLQRSFGDTLAGTLRRSEQVARFDSVDAGPLVITPAIILRMQQKPEEMELGDFRDYIERQRLAGSDINRLLVDYHGKIAFPFASLIVMFFGVPFASVKRRSGLSVQFGVSILICFAYLVSQKLSQVFGYNGAMPALLAAWLPNLAFLFAGIWVMLRVRK